MRGLGWHGIRRRRWSTRNRLLLQQRYARRGRRGVRAEARDKDHARYDAGVFPP
jgi:hypothetical protein